jgi:phage terminase large subunit-like protein
MPSTKTKKPRQARGDPWVRNPSDDLAVREGCAFDEAAGRRPIEFIERFCRQSKGRWAGRPLTLLDWQRDFVMRLFGWKRPDGTRRFRRAYLEVAKKNGKSSLYSGIALYLLMADGEGGPEIYLNAVNREQSDIIFAECRKMVASSPDLKSRLKVVDSVNNKRIVHPAENGVIIANSSVVEAKDGLNASAVLFDELHRLKTRGIWDVFEYAAEAREQPLTLSITTAGEDAEGVWHEQRDYSEKVNDGIIPDTSHFGMVYRALDTDDIDDPATWRKANPSMGVIIDEGRFAAALAEAKRIPTKLANFKRLRLCIIAREAAKFVDMKRWEACKGDRPPTLDDFADRPAWMGLDLSDNNDLTALVLVAGDVDEGFDVLPWFWLPEENIVDLEHKHGVPYRTWADMGLITLTPGPSINYGSIRKQVNEVAAAVNLQNLLSDPWHAHKLSKQLLEDDGIPVVHIKQNYTNLNDPTKQLDRLIRAGLIRHGGHPILAWHASNAIAVEDDSGNVRLSKRRSKKKIDGMSALVNAMAGATGGESDAGDSAYAKGGDGLLWA